MPTPPKLFSVCSRMFLLGSCSTSFPAPTVLRVAVSSGEFILPDLRWVFLNYEFLESALASYNIDRKRKCSFIFLYFLSSMTSFSFTSSHHMCMGLPLTKQLSATPAECPTVNSILTFSTWKEHQFHRLHPLHMATASLGSHLYFWAIDCKSEVLTPAP